MGGRGDISVVCESLVGSIDQKDVLWLQVGMDEIEIMKDWM